LYIADVPALESACDVMAAAPVIGIDTEFMRERTYYARLCLVQVATESHVYLLDAIALGSALKRLAPVLTDQGITKVVHAGSQDMEVLLRATGVVPSPVFDTQVAATLLGLPAQVGYGQLVKDVLGITLDKGDSFTDWSVRPLSERQLAYAAADVEHLPGVYAVMHEKLSATGRLAWLAPDFERLADPGTYLVDPREQYRRVKRAASLDRRALAVLREVAAWREEEAQRRDLPRRWLVSDESLIEIARRAPVDIESLAAIRGLGERVLGRSGAAILAAVAAGRAVPDEELPRLAKRVRVATDAQPVADLLQAVCRIRAREHGVAVTLLATREELERFAGGEREGNPLAEGWRHTLVGRELEDVLDGRVALAVDGGRIVLREAEPAAGDPERGEGA